jgi:hypothetical protein
MALPARLPFSPFALLATTLLAGGATAAGCIVDWAGDCGRDLDYPNCHGALSMITGGNTGSGGTGSSSSGGGADAGDAGEGGATGCTDAGSCPPPPPGPCASLGTPTCTNGVCGVTYTPGPAPSQVYGNCHKNMCATNGMMTSVEDDTNVFNDGNACDHQTCSSGAPNNTPTPFVACDTFMGNQVGVCEQNPDPSGNGGYVCSECDMNLTTMFPCNTVPPTVCSRGQCVPMHCTDGSKDVDETDVDCGGPKCLPCGPMKACMVYTDCFSKVCTGDVCAAPTCMDNKQNGAETDQDCGGGTCPPCGNGLMCLQPSDCKSGVCLPTATNQPDRCAAPTCTDGVKNGDETGVDCGGDGGCQPCGDGGG